MDKFIISTSHKGVSLADFFRQSFIVSTEVSTSFWGLIKVLNSPQKYGLIYKAYFHAFLFQTIFYRQMFLFIRLCSYWSLSKLDLSQFQFFPTNNFGKFVKDFTFKLIVDIFGYG